MSETVKKDGRGGKRKGAGRKSKAQELKAADLGTKAIEEAFGSVDQYWLHIAEEAKDSFPHLKLIHEFIYGKAKETKDIAITELPSITIIYEGDSKSKDDIIT